MRKKPSRLALTLAVLLSSLGHLAALHAYDPGLARAVVEEPSRVIELVQLPERIISQLALPSPSDRQPYRRKPETPEEKKRREDEEKQRMIVDLIVTDPNQPRPENADYLAEFNNRTDRETYRPGEGGMDGIMAMPDQPPRPTLIIPKADPSEGRKPQEEERPAAHPEPAPRMNSRRGEERPESTNPAMITVPRGSDRPEGGQTDGSGRAITWADLMLKPSDLPPGEGREYRPKVEGSGNGPDYLTAKEERVIPGNMLPGRRGSIEDLRRVTMGDITVLNAIAEKYAPFFNNVKRLIFFHWSSYVNNAFYIMKEYNPAYLGPGTHDLATIVVFKLTRDGKVVSKEVAQSCGVLRADDFALQSVRLAAPFPGVPEELLDENGELEIKFGFVIQRH